MRREKSLIVKVDESKCAGCGLCVDACPVGAITMDKVAKIDTGLCAGCLVCINECPNDAISTEKKNTASPFETSGLPQHLHIPAAQASRLFSPHQGINQPHSIKQANQSNGFLEQVFDFIGRTVNTGRGQGSGRGLGAGQGRGCGGGKGRGGGRGQGRNR